VHHGVARSHHVRANSVSEDGTQSVDQDRLAGAGFTGQDIETGTEGYLNGLDDGEIADGEFDEHGLESLSGALESIPFQQARRSMQ
jgi:hypothetical protein